MSASDDRSNAIRVQRHHHFRRCRSVHRFNRTRHAFFAKLPDDFATVCSRVRPDRDTLPGEPVALDLTLTAHSEVAECLLHVLIMAIATPQSQY